MRIGIVTTWFERGAAYVSQIYMKVLRQEGHEVFIYARGGESHPSQKNEKWNESYVTRSNFYVDSRIPQNHFFRWIKKKDLDIILFNEQREYLILYKTKEKFPRVKLGAYVDYYTEDTLLFYNLYDFVICNTKRHMQAMKEHPQKFYIPWGTDINLYKPNYKKHDNLTFFHSVGMSSRKGTDILVDSFIDGKLYEKSDLIIHTQIPIENVCGYTKKELEKYSVEVIEKTVTAPGLYYLGDIYVYPTRLDGLGLTMYEALSCGMPIITTDFPPMNEVGDERCTKRVKVGDYYCRQDAYYYPMAICDKQSLIDSMEWFVAHKDQLDDMKIAARNFALDNYDISKKSKQISDAIVNAKNLDCDNRVVQKVKKKKLREYNPVNSLRSIRFVDDLRKR